MNPVNKAPDQNDVLLFFLGVRRLIGGERGGNRRKFRDLGWKAGLCMNTPPTALFYTDEGVRLALGEHWGLWFRSGLEWSCLVGTRLAVIPCCAEGRQCTRVW